MRQNNLDELAKQGIHDAHMTHTQHDTACAYTAGNQRLAAQRPPDAADNDLFCPECETAVALHADLTLACACSTMEPEDMEPPAHWDTDADAIAAIRAAEPTIRCAACNQKHPNHAAGCVGRILPIWK